MARLATTPGLEPSKPHLCIVDADPRWYFLGASLRSVGFDVQLFDDGARFLLSNVARHCDALLVNAHMGRLHVRELQHALAAAALRIPLILVLDQVGDSPRQHGIAAPAAVLYKPIGEEALMAAVRVALAGGSTPAAQSLSGN